MQWTPYQIPCALFAARFCVVERGGIKFDNDIELRVDRVDALDVEGCQVVAGYFIVREIVV